jgi:hypothetical protein
MDSSLGKLIAAAVVITGIVIGVKNHNRDGFWIGAIAGVAVLGSWSISTYKIA